MLRFAVLATCSLLLIVPSANAGFFDDVSGMASDVGDFFTKNFNSAKDLFAGNQKDLEQNINRVKDLLTALKDKAKVLEPLASDSQKKALGKVNDFLNQVTSFQNSVKTEGQNAFNANSGKWQNMVTSIFEQGGIQDLMKLVTKSAGQYSLAIAAFIPVMMVLFR